MTTNNDRSKIGMNYDGDIKVHPQRGNVLVKLNSIEETSESGIILHTNEQQGREQDGQDMGVLVSMGPLAFIEDCDGGTAESRAELCGFKIGDEVMFTRYDGERPRISGYEDYRITPSVCLKATIERVEK